MKSKSQTATLFAEYQRIPGKKGMFSSYDDVWFTRLVVKYPGKQLIVEERLHKTAAEAKDRYDALRQAIGVA
jgi:hypothetical protein